MNYSNPNCDFDPNATTLKWILHSMTMVTVPINYLCFYILLNYSPKNYGSYKWHLLCFQQSGAITDIMNAVFVVPRFFIPFYLFETHGIFNYFGISTLVQTALLALVGYESYCCSVVLLFFRLQAVVPRDSFLDFRPSVSKVIIFCLYFANFPMLAIFYCTQIYYWDLMDERVKQFLEELPCFKPVFDKGHFWLTSIPDYALVRLLFILLSIVSFHSTYQFICIGVSFYYIRKKSSHMSEKTKELQKKMLVHLLIQMSTIYVVLGIPCLVLVTMIASKTSGSLIFGYIFTVATSLHGTTVSLSILMLNKLYFKQLKDMLCIEKIWPPGSMVTTNVASTTAI